MNNNETKTKNPNITEQKLDEPNQKSIADEEILQLAHQQQHQFEQERLAWSINKKEKTRRELELLQKNNLLQKEIWEKELVRLKTQ